MKEGRSRCLSEVAGMTSLRHGVPYLARPGHFFDQKVSKCIRSRTSGVIMRGLTRLEF